MLFGWREDIDDAAVDGVLAAPLDEIDGVVAAPTKAAARSVISTSAPTVRRMGVSWLSPFTCG